MFTNTPPVRSQPKSFTDWSNHYGYDPNSAEAQADYSRYLDQWSFFQSFVKEVSNAY